MFTDIFWKLRIRQLLWFCLLRGFDETGLKIQSLFWGNAHEDRFSGKDEFRNCMCKKERKIKIIFL